MKTWSELSDIEKGALLLAHHQGKTIQYLRNYVGWIDVVKPSFAANRRYRVKPVVVTRTLAYENYRVKFEIIDGVPDCNSVRMEKA